MLPSSNAATDSDAIHRSASLGAKRDHFNEAAAQRTKY
jgi:hypothetical protein